MASNHVISNIGTPEFHIFDITWLAYHVISNMGKSGNCQIRYYMVSWPCHIEYDLCTTILGYVDLIPHGEPNHVESNLHT